MSRIKMVAILGELACVATLFVVWFYPFKKLHYFASWDPLAGFVDFLVVVAFLVFAVFLWGCLGALIGGAGKPTVGVWVSAVILSGILLSALMNTRVSLARGDQWFETALMVAAWSFFMLFIAASLVWVGVLRKPETGNVSVPGSETSATTE